MTWTGPFATLFRLSSLLIVRPHLLPRCCQDRTNQPRLHPLLKQPDLLFPPHRTEPQSCGFACRGSLRPFPAYHCLKYGRGRFQTGQDLDAQMRPIQPFSMLWLHPVVIFDDTQPIAGSGSFNSCAWRAESLRAFPLQPLTAHRTSHRDRPAQHDRLFETRLRASYPYQSVM